MRLLKQITAPGLFNKHPETYWDSKVPKALPDGPEKAVSISWRFLPMRHFSAETIRASVA